MKYNIYYQNSHGSFCQENLTMRDIVQVVQAVLLLQGEVTGILNAEDDK